MSALDQDSTPLVGIRRALMIEFIELGAIVGLLRLTFLQPLTVSEKEQYLFCIGFVENKAKTVILGLPLLTGVLIKVL